MDSVHISTFLSSLIYQSAVQVGFVDPNSFNTVSLSAVLKPLENQNKFTCYMYIIYTCVAAAVWLLLFGCLSHCHQAFIHDGTHIDRDLKNTRTYICYNM
jgi:hypothetical protein